MMDIIYRLEGIIIVHNVCYILVRESNHKAVIAQLGERKTEDLKVAG